MNEFDNFLKNNWTKLYWMSLDQLQKYKIINIDAHDVRNEALRKVVQANKDKPKEILDMISRGTLMAYIKLSIKSAADEFDETSLHMRQLLKSKLVDMDLSVRALNCLKAADVETLGDLVSYNKNDLLKFRNFGKKSLTELEELVISKGLSFGMNVSKYLDKE